MREDTLKRPQDASADLGGSIESIQNRLTTLQQELNELLVRTNLALNREENAKGISKTLVEQQPSAMNMNLRAQVLLATGDTVQAARMFGNSLKLDSGIRENYLGLGTMYRAEDQVDNARALMSGVASRVQNDEE